MEIYWTENLVEELHKIVLFLNRHEIGQIIEKLADFYIQKYQKLYNINDYTMNFADSISLGSENINNGEYKLAYICEIIHTIKNHDKKRLKSFETKNSDSCKAGILNQGKNLTKRNRNGKNKNKYNVYIYISQMIKFCIMDIFKLYTNKTDYKIFYLVSILKDKFLPSREREIKGIDPILEIFNLSYFFTTEIIRISSIDEKLIFRCNSLILETENLDISFLNQQEIREILQILNTKRTLYVRILLVLAYEILKSNDILNPMWISRTLSFDSYDSLVNILTSPLIEVLILMTAYRINLD
jgi:hypothetical protein